MSKRMIDEGALNAQIQEATTTKQDKLKAGTGITIGTVWEPNKIESNVIWYDATFSKRITIPAKTYKAGDLIEVGEQGVDGIFLGISSLSYPVLPVGATGMKVLPIIQLKSMYENRKIYIWLMVINDTTLSTDTEFSFQEGYIYMLNQQKYTRS